MTGDKAGGVVGGLGGTLGEGPAIDGVSFATESPVPDKDANSLCFDEVAPVWSIQWL